MTSELRYSIDSWDKLVYCYSNTSRDLRIAVSDAIQDARFSGTIISVQHPMYGTLFACTVGRQGTLIDSTVPQMSTQDILTQLAAFGFLVEFSGVAKISDKQLKLIKSAHDLGMNKIRVLSVYGESTDPSSTYVVAFNDADNGDWLNNMYSPSTREFHKALVAGNAINVSTYSTQEHFDWSWLYGSVQNTYDILTTHGYQLVETEA